MTSHSMPPLPNISTAYWLNVPSRLDPCQSVYSYPGGKETGAFSLAAQTGRQRGSQKNNLINNQSNDNNSQTIKG